MDERMTLAHPFDCVFLAQSSVVPQSEEESVSGSLPTARLPHVRIDGALDHLAGDTLTEGLESGATS
ncbi:hypothetical protein [Ktedonospora formicarum]|uniref:Uncharacterized protein n=1 Tax=Ktedonospora formicarum TaxID=2778364 RepID=A0A8J3I5J3_9CHLR|nr:hypothetical protein [Ktedonospora formicarum]GHO47468.1 hypothetical protein KSX_56310 [Ktedonospora formicarum]